MTRDVVSLVASLIALVFSLFNTRNVELLPRSKLATQRFLTWIVAVGSFSTIVLYPVAALTVDPRHGVSLALAMLIGAVQCVVLALQFAILHHIRIALEASP